MNAKFLLPALTLFFSSGAWAGIPTLDNLDQADLDNVSKEFSANFMHTTVSPAKDLGHIWGFEIGLVGGITKTPKLAALVHEVSPSTKVDKLPHGGLLGMLTVPYGITGEFTMIPEKNDFRSDR